MLMDSAHVQAKDAERALRHRERDRDKGKVTGDGEETILYNSHDVERCVKQLYGGIRRGVRTGGGHSRALSAMPAISSGRPRSNS